MSSLEPQQLERLAAVVARGNDGLALRVVGSATRWCDDVVCVPRHLLQAASRDSLHLLLDASRWRADAAAESPQLVGPICELPTFERADSCLSWIGLPDANARGIAAPTPVAFELEDPTLVIGLRLGGQALASLGALLPTPTSGSQVFEGILRGDQELPSGLSGAPVFSLGQGGSALIGVVLGALESSLGRELGLRSAAAGARIFPFFAPWPRGKKAALCV